MIRRSWPIIMASSLLAALILSTPMAAQDPNAVEGRVTNGTSQAAVPSDIPVTLQVLDGERVVETRRAKTRPDGAFVFTGVSAGGLYRLAAEYQGAVYRAEFRATASMPLNLKVYESTTSMDMLTVDSYVMLVAEADPLKGMEVLELVALRNAGDRTFVPEAANPGRMQFLRFSLPPGAADLEAQTSLEGGDIIDVGTGFALTSPVSPGSHELLFRFQVPYEGGRLAFDRSFYLKTEGFRVLISQGLGEAHSAAFEKTSSVTVGQKVFNLYETGPLDLGATVRLEFWAFPQPSVLQRVQRVVSGPYGRLGVPILLGASLTAVMAYLVIAKRASSRGRAVASLRAGRREELTLAIAHLDDSFQRGELGEEGYGSQRRELKGQLLRLSVAERWKPGSHSQGGSSQEEERQP